MDMAMTMDAAKTRDASKTDFLNAAATPVVICGSVPVKW